MTLSPTLLAFSPALPEIILAITALFMVLVGAFRGDRSSGFMVAVALASFAVAGYIVCQKTGTVSAFGKSFVSDDFARFMKVLALGASSVALLMGREFMKKEAIDRFEYPILVVLATIGMMVMISANDLIALYMGLELQSLALYVIASLHRDNVRSTEAGLKYFVLGAISSGMLLYGASLVYGFTGAVDFAAIAQSVKGQSVSIGLVFGLVFMLAGLAFKVSAVPFHMWTPDVYEGAPTPVTAFFSAAPKVAAMAVLMRVLVEGFPHAIQQWQQVIAFMALASMGLGAFAAIGQRNIKRLMAYSSIANMGFALVGLAAATDWGVKSVVVYMAIYALTTLGAFAGVLLMRRGGQWVENVDDLAGLARHDLVMAVMLAALFLSLAGIPWMAGFFAKYYIFQAAIDSKLYALAIAGVLASVVGAYYYLRVVKVMFFDEPAQPFEKAGLSPRAFLVVAGVLVNIFIVFPNPLISAAEAAAKALF